MYKSGTILTLKSPVDPDSETGEEFPYNEVEVIGPSPISHGVETKSNGDPKWVGADADGVMLRALSNFGATLDEPFGKLRRLYDVAVEPDPEEIVQEIRIKVVQPTDLGPTPEQVFAEEAAGDPDAPRRPQPRSPLDDPELSVADGASPLGEVENDDETLAVARPTSPLGD